MFEGKKLIYIYILINLFIIREGMWQNITTASTSNIETHFRTVLEAKCHNLFGARARVRVKQLVSTLLNLEMRMPSMI